MGRHQKITIQSALKGATMPQPQNSPVVVYWDEGSERYGPEVQLAEVKKQLKMLGIRIEVMRPNDAAVELVIGPATMTKRQAQAAHDAYWK